METHSLINFSKSDPKPDQSIPKIMSIPGLTELVRNRRIREH